MKHTLSPIVATVIIAAGAAALLAAVTNLPLAGIRRATAVNAAIFVSLAVYALFLARLSRRRARVLFAPLFMLSAVMAAAGSVGAFAIPAVAGFAWIRSGVCFPEPPARRICAEAFLTPAGLTLAWLLPPPGPYGWALGIWLFGLTQAFYFMVLDAGASGLPEKSRSERTSELYRNADVLIREKKLARAFEELGL
ncbi:MAG: hypothetical protein R6V84_18210 [Desulfobacterales bacterium]